MLDPLRKWAGGLLLLTLASWTGCGSSEPTTIKKELTEEEKRQIQELNEQRASEWGMKGK